MNTFGLHSINKTTLNLSYDSNLYYPQEARNSLVTFLRIHNLTLNILGYIPGISLISGCVRIATGAAIVAITLCIGDRNATKGALIGRWCDEALITGIAQIGRGILEAFVPFGWIANLSLDVICTPINLFQESYCPEEHVSWAHGCGPQHLPHADPEYPHVLNLLHLA